MTAVGSAGERDRSGLLELLGLVRGHRRQVAGTAGLTLLASALGIAQPMLVRQAVSDVGHRVPPWSSAAVLLALFVGQALARTGGRYLMERTSEHMVLGLRLDIVGRLLRLRMNTLDGLRRGDLLTRVSADCTMVRDATATLFSDAVVGAVGVLAAAGLMLWLDPVLFALVLGLTGGSTLVVWVALRGIRRAALRAQEQLGEMTADLDRALGAIRTVRASHAEHRETDRIGRAARAVCAEGVRGARLRSVARPAAELALTGSFLIVLLVGGVRVTSGHGSVADLVAFLLYLTYLVMPLGAVFEALGTAQRGVAGWHRVRELLALPVERGGAVRTRQRPADHGGDRPVLEFQDVWFGYRARPVLRGVSFRIPSRGVAALVGRSGAGKSTVFALAQRFYEPDRGTISLQGGDIRQVELDEHRRRIGLVEQDAPVLHGSLRDNLCYATPNVTADELRHAVELAQLDDVLARLPHGLDTEVGDHGTLLSGGERQRVAIARALLGRPDVLLLDEPTSQLDAVNEAALAKAIIRVSAERAVLVIAHRISTVRDADRIVVLDEGRVDAVGRHDDLLARCALYRRLATPPRAAAS